MKKCRKCGRPLNEDENDLCPACESTQAYKQKRWFEIIGGMILVVIGIGIKVLVGGKDNWKI